MGTMPFHTGDLRTGTLEDWGKALRKNLISCTTITDLALTNARDTTGEGARVFIERFDESASAAAEALDADASAPERHQPLAGLPISIKDLFDVEGQVTRSGSVVLSDAPRATKDAEAVHRLRKAGAVIVGRTNMTEFAYSGLGLNPHYGTPSNPFDRERQRIPGGSSSGAAISVTDGMALAAIGSDTGGSLRIPAAFCGLVGFKPTQSRMPMDGVLPLSQTLDTIGPIARSVACCALLDSVLAGDPETALETIELGSVRFGVLGGYVNEDLAPEVAAAFEAGLSRISSAGGVLMDMPASMLDDIPEINRLGGFAAAESYASLRYLLDASRTEFDPRVAQRIEKGAAISTEDYDAMKAARAALIDELRVHDGGVDVWLCPTVPMTAPRLRDLSDDEEYARTNLLVLRNPSVANFLDRPAISLPCHVYDGLPVGLMMIGQTGQDRRLLAVAAACERLVASSE